MYARTSGGRATFSALLDTSLEPYHHYISITILASTPNREFQSRIAPQFDIGTYRGSTSFKVNEWILF